MKPHRKIALRRRRSDNAAGFTLVEAVFAIVIFVIGLLAVSNLFLVAASQTHRASCLTASTAQASQALDLLKAMPFDNLTPGGNLDDDEDGFNMHTHVPGVSMVVTRWTIEAVSPQFYYITVQAEPVSALGQNFGRVTFMTFRTKTT